MAKIINLIYESAENSSEYNLDTIISALQDCDKEKVSEFFPHLELLLDSWGASIEESLTKALFCVRLALMPGFDAFPHLRSALIFAIKRLSPDTITKTEAIMLSAVREGLPLRVIAQRILKISNLSRNHCVYNFTSSEWLQIKNIDSITHMVESVNILNDSRRLLTLDAFISDSLFFKFDSNTLMEKINNISDISYNKWRAFLVENSLYQPDDEQIRKISLNTLIPKYMSPSQFNVWIEKDHTSNLTKEQQRSWSIQNARNSDELLLLLENPPKEKIEFSEEDLNKISYFLAKIPLDRNRTGLQNTIEIISRIYSLADDSKEIYDRISVKSKVILDKILNIAQSSKDILTDILDELSVPLLKSFCKVLLKDYSENHGEILSLFSVKALNQAASILGEKRIFEILSTRNEANPNFLLWVWKNRKKSLAIEKAFSVEKIFSAIACKSESKAVTSAVRELKKLITSNDEFVAKIAEVALDDSAVAFGIIERDKTLSPQEKQSLIVKLSRVKPDFADHIETQFEKGALNISNELYSARKPSLLKPASLKSYNEKVRELEDIVKRQLPENSAAIAHARGYGDLRENAEYSAAKERQKFLNRRKAQIERELSYAAPTTFKDAPEQEKIIKAGRKVKITKKSDNSTHEYFILGVWDSDPDRNFLSCESELAKTIIGKTEGETFSFNHEEYLISNVSFLPPELLAELNEEANK